MATLSSQPPTHETLLATFLIGASTIVYIPGIPKFVSYLIVLGAAGLILAYALFCFGSVPVQSSTTIFMPLFVLWVIFIIEIFRLPTATALLRAPTFVLASAFFVFVVPAILPQAAIENGLIAVGATAVLIALPALINGAYSIGFIAIRIGKILPGPAGAVGLHSLRSIFSTPNVLAVLALFGAIAAASATQRDWLSQICRSWYALLSIICTLGLFAAFGRAALLAIAVAVMLTLAYRVFGRTGIAIGVFSVATAAATVTLIVVFTPGLLSSIGISLTNRNYLWPAAAAAIAEHPIIGWGFIPPRSILETSAPVGVFNSTPNNVHNSYLRLFFIGGIIGGVSYMTLIGVALWNGIKEVNTTDGLSSLLILSVTSTVILLFNSSTIFGLSLISVVSALFVGYSQSEPARWKLQVPTVIRRWIRTDSCLSRGD